VLRGVGVVYKVLYAYLLDLSSEIKTVNPPYRFSPLALNLTHSGTRGINKQQSSLLQIIELKEEVMVDDNHVFTASRLTSGNLFFPVRIEINQNRITRIKPRLFGSNEESIAIVKVASVNIKTGLIWSDIRIDSAGGSNPIVSHGHHKDDARAIRDLIERHQQTQRTSQGPDA